MRARSASISASGAIGIVNGRIVVADIGCSLRRGSGYDASLLVRAPFRAGGRPGDGYLGCSLGRTLGSARVGAGQRVRQFPPGTDAELGEHVTQMPLNGPRA